tara:strand:- start:852 stop:1559 length:708 start_codon:yes stop_codon:yes gene_type:complete
MKIFKLIWVLIAVPIIVLIFTLEMIISMLLFPLNMSKSPLNFWITRGFLRAIYFLLGVTLDVEGLEHIPQDHAFILCANHTSMLDIGVIIMACNRPIFFIAKQELRWVPILGKLMFFQGHYFINRKNRAKAYATLDKVKSNFAKNRSIMIFPEGTRSKDGQVGQFKKGAFKLAEETNTPILPCGIHGAFEACPRGRLVPKNGHIHVRFGPLEYPKGDSSVLYANSVQEKVASLMD